MLGSIFGFRFVLFMHMIIFPPVLDHSDDFFNVLLFGSTSLPRPTHRETGT